MSPIVDPGGYRRGGGIEFLHRASHERPVTFLVIDGGTRSIDVGHDAAAVGPVARLQGETDSGFIASFAHGGDAECDQAFET